jgi:hypothetical protein
MYEKQENFLVETLSTVIVDYSEEVSLSLGSKITLEGID